MNRLEQTILLHSDVQLLSYYKDLYNSSKISLDCFVKILKKSHQDYSSYQDVLTTYTKTQFSGDYLHDVELLKEFQSFKFTDKTQSYVEFYQCVKSYPYFTTYFIEIFTMFKLYIGSVDVMISDLVAQIQHLAAQ